jgi:hypothetical protein
MDLSCNLKHMDTYGLSVHLELKWTYMDFVIELELMDSYVFTYIRWWIIMGIFIHYVVCFVKGFFVAWTYFL